MSKLLSCVQDMFDIIDSYEYREQLLMPKLVITAANDEFFLPTDSRYWWADMPDCTVLYCTVLYCTVLYSRYWWADMPDQYILNRLLILPNSGMEAYFIGILSF